jgi:hypothetical protein
MLLVIFMAACGGDDGGGDGGVTPPPPAGVQYQAFLVDAAAESNGQTLPVDFTAGDIPGSIVGLQD